MPRKDFTDERVSRKQRRLDSERHKREAQQANDQRVLDAHDPHRNYRVDKTFRRDKD